jgi:hypothetical protein
MLRPRETHALKEARFETLQTLKNSEKHEGKKKESTKKKRQKQMPVDLIPVSCTFRVATAGTNKIKIKK